jgi:PAS domain S-box-containing protein
MFKNLRIRHKLLVSYGIVFIVSISLGSAFIYTFVRQAITANLENELTNATNSLRNMVMTSAAVSIKNHLRAVAEKNLEIVQYLYAESQIGRLSEGAAKQTAVRLMLSQTIGKSGYIYCLDSRGRVVVHPQSALLNQDVSGYGFVQQQLKRKQGYIEYDWQNPGESRPRAKALYMLYFAPWDWIISASTYRSEFKSLVNVEDFRESVMAQRFGKSGYAFVIDGKGGVLIHPRLQDINLSSAVEIPQPYLQEMLARKSGKMVFSGKKSPEASARQKLVIFAYLADYDWIVASCSYLDEFYAPLRTIRDSIIATVAASLLLVLPISFAIGASITGPLQRLMRHFDRIGSPDFASRMQPDSKDEIGQLAVYYNRFMEQLETYSSDLKRQIEERRKAEEALRESEARYRSVMEAAPDPIVVYDMQGRVVYLNPAFSRVFGWSLEECRGHKMDHFVPAENWDETRRMIAAALSGETLSAISTRRLTRSGNIIEVSISGATFRDHNAELAGSVIILRDVTKSRQLQMQVMDIGDRERRKIGQDLHDDLCPHLIGIQGLGTVLKANLSAKASEDERLAGKIVELIAAAIDKSRRLARGLCPVDLVSHGLFAALADIAAQTEAAFGLACRFDGDEQVIFPDSTVATHLYYIAKEAVANAVKHARAKRIHISLARVGDRVHLKVADNGIGLTQPIKSGGLGLQIMPYRARIIGAAFEIDSTPNQGTVVHVSLKAAGPVNTTS